MSVNKWLWLAGLWALGAAGGAAEAQTRPGFELGAELFDYGYRERLDGETVARDDGTFGGITLGYVETIGGGSFLRAKYSMDFGSVDYSSDDGRIEGVSQDIGQLELHFGHDFAAGESGTVTPFVGLGARILNDNSGGKTTADGLFGYDREISYSYVPVGVDARLPIGRATLILSAQYDWLVGGEARSNFSDIDPSAPDVKLDLDKGHGIEASAMVALPLGRHAIAFGPFVRTWTISRSESFSLADPEDPTTGLELFEPRNRTTELGVRLSFAF